MHSRNSANNNNIWAAAAPTVLLLTFKDKEGPSIAPEPNNPCCLFRFPQSGVRGLLPAVVGCWCCAFGQSHSHVGGAYRPESFGVRML